MEQLQIEYGRQKSTDMSLAVLSGDADQHAAILDAIYSSVSDVVGLLISENWTPDILNSDHLNKSLSNTRYGFFDFHYKYYNRNKRSVPIYRPLQISPGSFTIWIYYNRLNEQTLFSCVNDFVEPKLKTVEQDLSSLRDKSCAKHTRKKKTLVQFIRLSKQNS